MKNTKEIYEKIFECWYNDNLSYKQIANMEFQCNLSLKRIRNIIYRRQTSNEIECKVFAVYLTNFLTTRDKNKSIYYVYDNQPEIKYTENRIRYIINKMLTCKYKIPTTYFDPKKYPVVCKLIEKQKKS